MQRHREAVAEGSAAADWKLTIVSEVLGNGRACSLQEEKRPGAPYNTMKW